MATGAQLYWPSLMSRLFVRRSLTAVGMYSSVVLGFAALAPARLAPALLLAAGIPLGQALEGLGAAALFLRGRYDIRSLLLAWSMGLRLAGVAIGARYGVATAIAGVLAAQVVAT